MQKSISTYTPESRGRVLLLFLLFLVSIYEFISAGFTAFAIVCAIPLMALFVIVAFKYRMTTFWALFVVNYFVMWWNKNLWLPGGIPLSLYNEILEVILLAIAIIDARQIPHFERMLNTMFIALITWCGFCVLEVFNDTCGLGFNLAGWYTSARLIAFQILYAFLVYSIYISTPEILTKYLKVWALLSLFSAFWTWKQVNFGFTVQENAWLQNYGYRTHILQAGTLIRYFSTFNDAATYGCNAAATAVAMVILAFTSRFKKDKIFYGIVAICVIWAMFSSGTRTAIVCLGAGLMTFIFLSKSIKIAVPFTILFFIGAFLLIFTKIGDGNQQIRRMRSAFNKEDASANTRTINQAAISKYLKDAPWGMGLLKQQEIPANNKYSKLNNIPPDSEYVYIWVRTGVIGITVFLITTAIMFIGACVVVLFRLKSPTIRGVGAAFCGAFAAIQLGGYGNQILMQFPNCMLFYGGLAIVYLLPHLEPAWIAMEDKMAAEEEGKKIQKLEKKKAVRV
jgi:hypothetical protein